MSAAWAAILAAFLLGLGAGVTGSVVVDPRWADFGAYVFMAVLTAAIASITRDIDWDDNDNQWSYGLAAVFWPVGLPLMLISSAVLIGQERRQRVRERRKAELEEAKLTERLLKSEVL